jgi:recombination protein RecA
MGNETRVKIVKNKMAPPFRQAEFSIMYGEGVSHAGEVLDMGVNYGHVKKSGAWYAVGTERIGQGRDNAINFLKENPDMLADIEAKVRAELGMKSAAEAVEE